MGTIDVVPMLMRATALAGAFALLGACAAPSPSGGAVLVPRGSGIAILDGAIGQPRTASTVISSGALGGSRAGLVPSPPDPAERAMATAILSDLQWQSFAENREFCGYLVRDRTGTLGVGPINRGVEAACPLPQVPARVELVASIHTHSTYSPYFQSEFPTVQDMLTDAATGINGFISTPGGRLWYVDGAALVATQLCGRGCLPQDPNYDPRDDGDVRQSYTLDELRRREAF